VLLFSVPEQPVGLLFHGSVAGGTAALQSWAKLLSCSYQVGAAVTPGCSSAPTVLLKSSLQNATHSGPDKP